MDSVENILTILERMAPLTVAVVVLSLVLLGILYLAFKLTVPSIRQLMDMFETQRTAWKDLTTEQRKFFDRLVSEHEERIEKLETESKVKDALIATLRDELQERDDRIDALERELQSLKSSSSEKIEKLQEELKQVRAERDELRARLKVLEDKDKSDEQKT